MKVPEEDDYGYGYYDSESEGEKKEADKANQLYTPAALMEEVDAIVGIKHEEYAMFEVDEEEEQNMDTEIAMIGFWRLKETGVFRCIHSFIVPNPVKRQITDTDGTVLYQVLFGGTK